MNVKTGIARDKSFGICLETSIADDNPVRLIDAFVEMLDLEKLGFTKTKPKKEGCPIYHASDMLKLHYYGYLNKVRSSHKLEAECNRNIELWWLVRQLKPSYHTIANFRKDNPKALKKAFNMFVSFLKDQDMFDKELLAQDGTKVRAQNNKRNNYNTKKLENHLKYISGKEEQCIKELEQLDAQQDMQGTADVEAERKHIETQQQTQQQRKGKYQKLKEQLKQSGEPQISTIDSDSRSLQLKDRVTNVCYNNQIVVDSKHCLIVGFDTINTTDQGQLSSMITQAMEALDVKEITALADAGYHVGKDLQDCKEQRITTLVAPGEHNSAHIDPAYQTSEFSYDKEQDCYKCPQGAILTTNGKHYEKKKKNRTTYKVKNYVTEQCLTCPARSLCTSSKSRKIERSEYQDIIDENNKRVYENPKLYKLRQQIVEHIFGTTKRGWGYDYTLLKGKAKVKGEMAIIYTMYNMRRAMSILGVVELISRLNSWKATFLRFLLPYAAHRQLIAA
jgi:transposase